MSIRDVVIYPDESLRKPCSKFEIFDDKLRALSEDMFDTMYANEGVGLAGPQIGVNKRIVVIDLQDESKPAKSGQIVLVNPKITSLGGDIVESQEGCLSVPGYQDKVQRYEKCSVEYRDLNGNACRIDDAEGLLAICLQHETDHLDGKLFIDKLSRLKRDRLHKKYAKILKEKQKERL